MGGILPPGMDKWLEIDCSASFVGFVANKAGATPEMEREGALLRK